MTASVTLSCDDGVGGSGCDKTYYTTDPSIPEDQFSEYISGTTTIEITTDTTLRFYSVDSAGNQESVKSEVYTIDVTPPTAFNPQPAADATDVFLGTTVVTIEFSEAINPSTINEQTFTLSGPFGAVPGTVSYDDVTNIATLTLSENLADTVTYTVTITTAVQDLVGNPMAADYSWSFDSAIIAWFSEGGSIVKLSSAQEELVKIDQINCASDSTYTQFALDDRDGSLWIGDTNGNRVFKLNNNGELRALIDQYSAQGTAIDPRDGSIWSSEYDSVNGSRKLIKRDTLGLQFLETALGLTGSMIDNAMTWYNGDDSLWFADYSTNVVKLFGTDAELSGYDLSGASGTNHIRIGGFIGQPFTVSAYQGDGMGGEGFVWASDRDGAVVKLAIDGTELLRRSPSGFFEVRHVSTDVIDGSVWLGDGNSNRVAKYSAAGDVLVNIGGFQYFRAVEADPYDGGAWVGYYDSTTTGGGLVKLDSTGAEEWRRTNTSGDVHSIVLQMQSSQRTIIYVSKSGSDVDGDGTQSNPYATISKGITETVEGNTVMVEPGTYNENIALSAKNGIKIIGSDATTTIIQGTGTTDVVSFVGVNGIVLSQFTITNNAVGLDAGVYCADCSGVVINKNIISQNGVSTSTTSVGVELQGASNVLIEQNRISANASGGIYISGASQAIIRNNLILSNYDNGIYSGFGTLPSLIANNLVLSNGTETNGRSGLMVFSNDVIKNNIIVNNGSNSNPNPGLAVGIYVGSGATPELSYNNVWANAQGSYTNVTAGTGDISEDPLLVVDDFHLEPGSPSIDTGDPNLFDAGVDCSTTASRSDMGVFGGPWGNW